MHIRVVIATFACVALIGCASTKSSQRTASTATKRVYQQSVTPRTSTPQARRTPSWPAQSYRAPSTRTYAAAPTRRSAPVARRSTARTATLTTRSFGTVPPPPPPPALYGRTAPRTTAITPARAPANVRSAIRPASRPARSVLTTSATPAIKPIAPVSSGSLFKGTGSYKPKSSSWPSRGFLSRKTRDCKT